MRFARRLCLVTVTALSLAGCGVLRAPLAAIPRPGGAGPTAQELHEALGIWANSFQGSVVAASDRIRLATTDREARRNSLFWQIRMIPLATQAAYRSDPQEAYVAVVALASAQWEYLRHGEGKTLFGEQQAIAIEAARDIEERALEIGERFLTEGQLQRLEQQVDELIAEHPIRGTFASDALIEGFAETRTSGLFSWVIDLPMVPFRALSGVSDTAQAVNTFNETAQEFTETVAALPHLTRWQLELLLYDTEELESVSRALAAAEGAVDAADRMSGVAETLPAELGAELEARLEQTRATIVELDALLVRAETLAGPLSHVADRVGEASAQWTALLSAMSEGDEDAEPGRPFDVREYEATAVRIAEASRELRALVDELAALDGDGGRALLDAATWRAALLIGVFFAALAAYRVILARVR
ncbi:MAG: hypothetical protein ABFS41_17610 [Myxococcota bacterium]